jgi:hypothetical protein
MATALVKGNHITVLEKLPTVGQYIFAAWQSKKLQVFLDVAYEQILAGKYAALIIPLQDWHTLQVIHKSYIQLTPAPVLFLLSEVPAAEKKAFIGLVQGLEKFRNVRIGLIATKVDWQELARATNFTNLAGKANQTAAIKAILDFKMPNKRKYIGWRYHANELRQKIKFNKDLLKHEARVKLKVDYKKDFDHSGTIPKVIHYCWFGKGAIPEKLQCCMATWQQILPDYMFKRWDENNFPIDQYPFAAEALQHKKWAFLADVARLHALYHEGGIYLDTDIEVLKPFTKFLQDDGFTCYESLNLMATGVMGFKKYHPWLALMLTWYEDVHCDEDYTEIANTKVVTKITRLHYGVKLDGREQVLPDGLHIYPRNYFSPELAGEKWQVTEETYCIHHFTGLW